MVDAPQIISEGNIGSRVMRGRDVRDKLHNRVDPLVVEVIASLAEINHTNMKGLAEMATMLDQIVNVVQQFSDVAENMKTRTDQMMRGNQQLVDASEGDENS